MAKVRPYKDIGDRIQAFRRRLPGVMGRGMTQAQVATAVGVDTGTVTAWEIGKQRPMGDNLVNLAEVLGVTPQQITGEQAGEDVKRETASQPSPDDKVAAFDALAYAFGIILRASANGGVDGADPGEANETAARGLSGLPPKDQEGTGT